jgi:hypothetical protein
MKVWCVIEGMNYEGESFNSLRVFSSEEKAEAYAEELRKGLRYGYVDVESREVE